LQKFIIYPFPGFCLSGDCMSCFRLCAGTLCTTASETAGATPINDSDWMIYCPMPFQPSLYSVCCVYDVDKMRCCRQDNVLASYHLSYVHFVTYTVLCLFPQHGLQCVNSLYPYVININAEQSIRVSNAFVLHSGDMSQLKHGIVILFKPFHTVA